MFPEVTNKSLGIYPTQVLLAICCIEQQYLIEPIDHWPQAVQCETYRSEQIKYFMLWVPGQPYLVQLLLTMHPSPINGIKY